MLRAALLSCMAAAAAYAASAQDRAATNCSLKDAGSATVRAVLDAGTFALTDGREVRLAALDFPGDAAAGKASLENMLGGRTVTLKTAGAETDRYGRFVAHAFAGEQWTQAALLSAGQARVAAQVGDAACAAVLLRTERAARASKLGLWADAANAPKKSADPAALLAQRGRFTLVEGRVISVRESGGTIYVNFGRRWSEDFTATVLRRHERTFAAAGLELKSLAGRSIRIRGVVEERGGPWIEVSRPEQIEVEGRN